MQAVQTTKQGYTNNTNANVWPKNGWIEPLMSAFAPWDKMGPRMPERNFFPVFNARSGFVHPMPIMNMNVPYNPPFVAQNQLVEKPILQHLC